MEFLFLTNVRAYGNKGSILIDGYVAAVTASNESAARDLLLTGKQVFNAMEKHRRVLTELDSLQWTEIVAFRSLTEAEAAAWRDLETKPLRTVMSELDEYVAHSEGYGYDNSVRHMVRAAKLFGWKT